VSDYGRPAKTEAAAARTDASERRYDNTGHQRPHEEVVELHGVDVVLVRESWWRGDARIELSTMRQKAVTAALIGDRAWVAIGGQQRVDEHEQGMGKLARGLMGARDAWWRLPTAMPSVAEEEEAGGGRRRPAQRRPEGSCTGGRAEQSRAGESTCSGRKKGGKGSKGPVCGN
jgi:hypothetical protein